MLVGGAPERLSAFGHRHAKAPVPALAAALILHMALLALAVFLRFSAPPNIELEIPVRVSIVAPSAPAVAAKPAAKVLAAPQGANDSPKAKTPSPQAAEPGMIVASTMLSGKTLADPRSRQARRDLATFADSERVAQLCNLEAMDQIHAWRAELRPEKLLAYARSNEKVSGDTIRADGAAFFSRNAWYDLKFSCRISPDHREVLAFAFAVGEPVPKAAWDELGLPAGGDED